MKGLFKLRFNVSCLDRWCNPLGLAIVIAFPLFSVTSALSIRASRQPQYLPTTAAVMLSDGKLIELEVARTKEQQAKGLMYRPPLTPNRGMMFPVTPSRKVVLWTKSMQQSIDVLFVYRARWLEYSLDYRLAKVLVRLTELISPLTTLSSCQVGLYLWRG